MTDEERRERNLLRRSQPSLAIVGGKDALASQRREGLTARQEAFAQAMAEGLTQKEAYARAAPEGSEMSDATLGQGGHRMIRMKGVVERVRELREEAKVRGAKVREVQAIGEVKPHDPAETRAFLVSTLQSIAIDTLEKTSDRLKAIELMGKVRGVGLFADTVEIEDRTTPSDRLALLHSRLVALGAPKPLDVLDVTPLGPKAVTHEPE